MGRGRQRGLLAEVEKGLAAVGQLQGHEAAAAQVAGGRVDDQRVAHGHRGIGIAAALEHLDPTSFGQVLGVTTMPFSANRGDRGGQPGTP
jgi:hypothetical protein